MSGGRLISVGTGLALAMTLAACGDPPVPTPPIADPAARPEQPTVTGPETPQIDQEDPEAGLNHQRPDGIQDVEPEDGGSAGISQT